MSSSSARLVRELVRGAWGRAAASGTERETMTGLERARRLLRSSPRLRQFLLHPGIGRQNKEALLLGIRQLPAQVRELLLLMAQRRVFHLLGGVSRAFRAIAEGAAEEKEVRVHSAVPLSPRESAMLARAVSRGVGRKVRVSVRVRKDLLGGLMVQLDDRILDGSLKGAFDRLRGHMLTPRSQAGR